jgi:hypothetical protein
MMMEAGGISDHHPMSHSSDSIWKHTAKRDMMLSILRLQVIFGLLERQAEISYISDCQHLGNMIQYYYDYEGRYHS